MTVLSPQTVFPLYNTADLRPLREQETLLIAPDGQMYEISAPPHIVGRFLSRCDGNRSSEDLLAETDDPKGWLEVLELLLESRCLLPKPVEASEPIAVNLHIYSEEPFNAGFENAFALRRYATRESLRDILATLEPKTDVVLVQTRFFEKDFFLDVDRRCAELGLRWVSLHLDCGRAWLGPAVVPGRTADYRDLFDRRMCCSDSEELFAAESSLPILGEGLGPALPSAAEIAWVEALFATEVNHWLRGGSCRLLSAELEADPASMSTEIRPFLPMPHRRLNGEFLCSVAAGPNLLVNDRAGAVIRSVPVEHHPSVPRKLVTVQAHVSNIARKYPCANDVIVGGSSFGQAEASFHSAIGEAVERYCGNYIPGETVRRASWNQLKTAGEYALDPESLVLFDKAMYREPGCPLVPFDRDLEVLWVRGRSLSQDRDAWLPISLVYVNWHTAYSGEPLTNYYWFPGIAAGVNLEHALTSGLEEVIERDITMIWWMNRQPLPVVKPTPELAALFDEPSRAMGQRPWLIHLDNEFGIPVVAGVLENTQEGFFNIGFGCRPDPVAAAAKAWTEALTLQEGSRDMDDPNGLLRGSVEEWGLIDVPYKDWRADRRYLDDYRADFRDVSDLLQQQQVNLDPRCLERVRSWVDLPPTRSFAELPSLPDRRLTTIQQRIESRGFEIFYKDITTADVQLSGLVAARVLVPGLAPNASAAFPPLGLGRVQRAPVELGWRDQPLSKSELNYQPLPHA